MMMSTVVMLSYSLYLMYIAPALNIKRGYIHAIKLIFAVGHRSSRSAPEEQLPLNRSYYVSILFYSYYKI